MSREVGDWVKCCYCGKQYQVTSKWNDDGFCCGRCRHLAKERKIAGYTTKSEKLATRIILGGILLFFILLFFLPKNENKREKSIKGTAVTEETINSNVNSRDAEQTTNLDEANTDNNEAEESSTTEDNSASQTEDEFVPIGGSPDLEPATNEESASQPTETE